MKKKTEVMLPKGGRNSKKRTYSNLKYKHMAKKEMAARRRAEELAKLPKQPIKRFFARLHPKRVLRWLFSWQGQKTILKGIAALCLIGIIFIGGLFLYYKKDLEEIALNEMQISETVNTYLDRNGVVLWQDTGSDDYRLVVDGSEISTYMRQATVAIEDKNFYTHAGIDLFALTRAALSTLTGQGVQGGSTLTQQLIKQVYFSDEAASSNRGGITRKIKEAILAIELERMYDKEQIITMYLNESPYGGRRNGIESAARTYFNKSAADLTLAESALLAGIPNNPAVLNPYNTYGNEALIARQHKVLDSMVSMGYITEEEANEAKEVAILDTINPEANQYSDIIAPHFVLEVRSQLEEKYGIATMRAGGWTITTTLDARAQEIAEKAVAEGMALSYSNNSDNAALVSIDVDTSQVIAMVGSADFSNVTYGEMNVAVDSLIEPGSTIKPILDYSALFEQRDGVNYGPGSILKDENIDSIYCVGTTGACSMSNATNQFYGDVSIRFSLGHSLNIAAVKALYINGIDNSLKVAHALGDVSYCDGYSNYGLSIAIGSGCGVRMVEHANAYASIARGGAYKDVSYILEVKNSSGDIIESWSDSPSTQVIDQQTAYMLTSILSDPNARFSIYGLYGSQNVGFVVPGVWTATKTGTTTTSNSSVTKDSLMESYSSVLSTFVWNGNHDGSGLTSNMHTVPGTIMGYYMEHVHKEVYAADGKWSAGDKIEQPSKMKTLTVNGVTDVWPSWFDPEKNSGVTKETLVFNKYNHLLASSCTADDYKISVEVTKTMDGFTNKETYTVPEPYNKEESDTCDYEAPAVSLSTIADNVSVLITAGSKALKAYTLYVDGEAVESGTAKSGKMILNYVLTGEENSLEIVVTDTAGYSASDKITY